VNLDRTAQGAAAFVLAQSPRRLYALQWPGVVVAQGGPDSFDFQPDDPRIPGVSGVPLRLPAPGFTVTVDPAQRPRALLAFAQGDPSRPELHLWERAGLSALSVQAASQLSLLAPLVDVGAAAGPFQGIGLGETLKTFLDGLKLWLDTHTHPTVVGPTSIPTVLSPSVPAVASTSGKVAP